MRQYRSPLDFLKNEIDSLMEAVSEKYPTLADMYLREPTEILERYPLLPALITLLHYAEDSPFQFFLPFKKAVSTIPVPQQKELVSHFRANMVKRWGERFTDSAIRELIEKLGLSFSLESLDACQRCGQEKCPGVTEICSSGWDPPGCGELVYACASRSHSRIHHCDICGDQYRECSSHPCQCEK